jgi:hypothetical protein|tara:strand:+ start:332 stop:706 length:375 start_codon:yes stop_codon:yes gene_type:complete
MAYGIQIKNSSNNITLDTTTRVSNIVVSGTISVNSGTTQEGGYNTVYSDYVNFPGSTNTSGVQTTAEFAVWVAGQTTSTGAGASLFEHIYIQFRYYSSTSQFRIKYQTYIQNKAMTYKYIGFRF